MTRGESKTEEERKQRGETFRLYSRWLGLFTREGRHAQVISKVMMTADEAHGVRAGGGGTAASGAGKILRAAAARLTARFPRCPWFASVFRAGKRA